jgi:hypothetical protein
VGWVTHQGDSYDCKIYVVSRAQGAGCPTITFVDPSSPGLEYVPSNLRSLAVSHQHDFGVGASCGLAGEQLLHGSYTGLLGGVIGFKEGGIVNRFATDGLGTTGDDVADDCADDTLAGRLGGRTRRDNVNGGTSAGGGSDRGG